jgi:hypothetical protein
MSLEDIEAEYWAYQYANKPAGEEFEDEDFDAEAVMAGGSEWEELVNLHGK